jgi:hypothetical protein
VDKVSPLSKGTHYSYVVTAKNAIGVSEKSPEAQSDKLSLSPQLAVLLIGLILVISLTIFAIVIKKYKSSGRRIFRKPKKFGQEKVWD